MPSKFVPLISLAWRHDYYTDNILRGVTLHPFPGTATAIRNYRLLVKQEPDRFRLLQEHRQDSSGTNPVIAIENALPLVFGFNSNDSFFQVKTGIDFFSSNRQKIVIDLRQISSPPEIRVLDIVKRIFTYHPGNAEEKEFVVSDREGNPVPVGRFDNPSGNVVIDLQNLPEDIYKIKPGNGQEKIFLLLHHDQKYEGIILMETSNADQNITIKFPSRNIYWEYVVVSKYDEYKEIELVEESGKIKFEKTIHGSIDKAFSFTSSEPVTLKDRYELSLQLEENGRVVKKNIPSGDMKNVDTCLINVHNFCLKNYVSV